MTICFDSIHKIVNVRLMTTSFLSQLILTFTGSVSDECPKSISTTVSVPTPTATASSTKQHVFWKEIRSLPEETGETRSWSNTKFHRLVLLEQLSYARLKKRVLMEQQAMGQTDSVLAEQQCDSLIGCSYFTE